MSIAHELSSDVAAALLSRQEDAPSVDSSRLVNVIVEVHSTLKHLTAEARRNNRRSQATANQPPGNSSSVAASGHH